MGKEEKKQKSRASMIIDGEIEPEDGEKYLLNLRKRKPFNQWDKERMHEVAVMGGKAVQELHGERRTAKQSLSNVLTLKATDEIIAGADIDPKITERLKRDNPNATIYDLIQAVAVGKALDGSIRAMEYVRDTNGDKPIDRVEVTENIMTDRDRELLQSISDRIGTGSLEVVKEITDDDVKSPQDRDGV